MVDAPPLTVAHNAASPAQPPLHRASPRPATQQCPTLCCLLTSAFMCSVCSALCSTSVAPCSTLHEKARGTIGRGETALLMSHVVYMLQRSFSAAAHLHTDMMQGQSAFERVQLLTSNRQACPTSVCM